MDRVEPGPRSAVRGEVVVGRAAEADLDEGEHDNNKSEDLEEEGSQACLKGRKWDAANLVAGEDV